MEKNTRSYLAGIIRAFCLLLALSGLTVTLYALGTPAVNASLLQVSPSPLEPLNGVMLPENSMSGIKGQEGSGEMMMMTRTLPSALPDYGSAIQAVQPLDSSGASSLRVRYILVGGVLLTLGMLAFSSLSPQKKQQPVPRKPSRWRDRKSTPTRQRAKTRLIEDLAVTHSALESLKERQGAGKVPSRQGSGEMSDIFEEGEGAADLDGERDESVWHRVSETPIPQRVRLIKAFFQQSGFEVVTLSEAGGVIRSKLSSYRRYGNISVSLAHETGLDCELLQSLQTKIAKEDGRVHGKLLFVIVDELPEAQVYHQIYTRKTEEDFAVIPISLHLITRAIRYASAAQTLEKIVNSALSERDPYETSAPVENSLEFFGRDDLMTTVLDAVNHLQHIGVFGARKSGKTSLLWQLRERLPEHVVAYIDLQHVPGENAFVYQRILEECLQEARSKYPEARLPEWRFSDEDASMESVRFIRELVRLWETVKTCRHDVKVVLLLDEAEHFGPHRADDGGVVTGFHEFMGVVRGISQQYGFLVSVVSSSRPDISRSDSWNGHNNPGFQFYKEIFLNSLPEHGNNQMIATLGARIGLTFTEEALSRMYYETGGHPYVTRQLCSLITQSVKTPNESNSSGSGPLKHVPIRTATIQVQDVENAISEYIEHKSDYLRNIWQRLSSEEQEILLTIAMNDSCALEDLIPRHEELVVKRQRRKSISTLIEHQMVEKCENKYSMKMGLLERFLLTTN